MLLLFFVYISILLSIVELIVSDKFLYIVACKSSISISDTISAACAELTSTYLLTVPSRVLSLATSVSKNLRAVSNCLSVTLFPCTASRVDIFSSRSLYRAKRRLINTLDIVSFFICCSVLSST